MTDEVAIPRASRSRKEYLRYLIGIAVGVVVLVLLFGKRGDLAPAWHEVTHAAFGWVLAAASAEALSFVIFAYLQNYVVELSGGRIPLPPLLALSLANEAVANTMPAGAAISSAYRYRYYRRWGVTSAGAGWTVFTVLIAQSIGLSLLLLLGALIALRDGSGTVGVGTMVVGLVIIATAVVMLGRRDLILRLAGWLTRRIGGLARRRAHARADGLAVKIESTLVRMREIPLSSRAGVRVAMIAAGVWFGDFLCLICGFAAIHAAIPWDGVLLAYGVAQVAGSLPVVPGGIGIIEGSLALILTYYGAARPSALAAALVYRLISFWLAIAVGWVTVGFISHRFRRPRHPHLRSTDVIAHGPDASEQSPSQHLAPDLRAPGEP